MSTTIKSLTIIGLGNMGAALAHAFLQGGVAVTAWNRTATRPGVKSVIEAGAIFDTDVEVAVSKNETVVISVLDYATIHKILDDAALSGSLKGKTVINLTNGTPKQARELAEFLTQHGVARYLDGAVMVTPQMVGTEQSFLVASGVPEPVFNELAEILRPTGQVHYRGQDVGAAALFDNAALASMCGMFQGTFIMLALLKKQRPDPAIELIDGTEPKVGKLAETTLVPFLQALMPYIGLIADSWDQRTWSENFGNPLGMQVHGLRNILQTCEDEGVDASPLQHMVGLMERAIGDHGEDSGIASVGTYLSK